MIPAETNLGIPKPGSDEQVALPQRDAGHPAGILSWTQYEEGKGRTLPYSQFLERNPEYKADFWQKCEAFYAGGPKLLEDKKLMERVFPKHLHEKDPVYDERRNRAHYMNYCGEIIDYMVAQAGSDPIAVGLEEPTDGKVDEAPEVPEWYQDFFENVLRRGCGDVMTINELAKDRLSKALRTKAAWLLVDLPRPENGYEPVSLADQEAAGGLDAYVVPLDTDAVIDWEVDDEGSLVWAITMQAFRRRAKLGDSRSTVVERYTYYTTEGWEVYEIAYKLPHRPKPEDPVHLVAEGKHSFDQVPLLRLALPDGLWAMAKLESLAREHMNKRNALSWAEYKSLLPLLYEFLGPEEGAPEWPSSEAQGDPDRAVAQTRGQGTVQVRGRDDKAEYIGPDHQPFEAALKSCHDVRDEMHRVTHQMALATNNSQAALKRSGESKKEDRTSATVVLTEFGHIVREFIAALYRLVGKGRGDAELDWVVKGMEKFDQASVDAMVTEAVNIEAVQIPSPTFKTLYLSRLAKKLLGEDATADEVELIREELEEKFAMLDQVPMGMGGIGAPMGPGEMPPGEGGAGEEEGIKDNPGGERKMKSPVDRRMAARKAAMTKRSGIKRGSMFSSF